MRRLFFIIVLCLLSIPLSGQQGFTKVTHAAITVDNTSGGVSFPSANLNPVNGQSTQAVCALETAEIRYQIDGTTAVTTTAGTLWYVGQSRTFQTAVVLKQFKAIRTGGTSGTLQCDFTVP